MSVNFETTPIYPDSASRRTDGSTIDSGSGASTANRFLLGLESSGGNSPGFHALLRFATGDVITDEDMTVVRARLRINAQARSTLGANYSWYAWASDFGSGALAVADYNQPYSNDAITAATLRVPIGVLFATGGTVTDGTVGEVAIPNRFIKKGSGNVSDFEVRPYFASTLPAGANLNIYGIDSGVGTARPRIIGWAYTDAELMAQNPYRFQAVGAETFVAFQLENSAGRAMKAGILLDARNTTLDSHAVNLESQSLTRQRARPRKVAVGRAGAGGDFTFEVTPEKWIPLMLGMMNYIGTEDVSSAYGGSNSGVNEHYFRTGDIDDVKTFTFVQRRGPFRHVYPGAMISSMDFSASLDEIVTAGVAVEARSEYNYDADASGINDANLLLGSAGYDTVANSVLSFVGAQVLFDDNVDRGIVQNFSLSLRQDVNERRGMNRKRDPFGHFPLGFRAELRFSLYLENEIQMRKYLGVEHKDFPFNAEKRIVFQKVEFRLAGAGGTGTEFLTDQTTYRQEFIFTVPKGMYLTSSKPVNGEAGIMMDCTLVGTYDSTTQDPTPGDSGNVGTPENGNVELTIRNSEAATVFTAPDETIPNLITVLPAGTSI
jgi:hypothetical protein